MVNKMDEEGFGNCTNTGACEVECPKGISLDNISRMNREFITANVKSNLINFNKSPSYNLMLAFDSFH